MNSDKTTELGNSEWFRIDHAARVGGAQEPTWRQSLYLGKPTRFDTRDQAKEALKNTTLYPVSLIYRIVQVTETLVDRTV